jgi:hypothetical protein
MPHMALAKYNHMIEALASDGADQSFSITVLPWRSRRCRSVANAHRANAARKRLAVDTVAITNEVVRREELFPRLMSFGVHLLQGESQGFERPDQCKQARELRWRRLARRFTLPTILLQKARTRCCASFVMGLMRFRNPKRISTTATGVSFLDSVSCSMTDRSSSISFAQ